MTLLAPPDDHADPGAARDHHELPVNEKTVRRGKFLPLLTSMLVFILLAAGGAVGGLYYLRGQEAAFVQAGQTALAAAEWAAARQEFDQALGVEPAIVRVLDAEAIQGRGLALCYLGENEAALADLEAALVVNPALDTHRACRASIWFEQGKVEQALPESEAVIESSTLDAGLKLALRQARLDYFFTSPDSFQAALAEGEQLLLLDPKAGLPYALRAWQQYQNLELDRALDSANTALRLDADLGLAYRVRGSLAAFQYDSLTALADLNRAIQLDGNDFHALAMRGLVRLQVEDHALALLDLEKAAQINATAPVVLFAQGMEKLYTYDEAAAASLLDKTLQTGTARPEYIWARSLAYTRTADRDKRISGFNRALEIQGSFAPALLSLAYDRLEAYDPAGIAEDALQLIQWMPSSPAPHLLLAQYYSWQREDMKAQAELARAVELVPDYSEIEIRLGWASLDQAAHEEALEHFLKASSLRENSLVALEGMGRVYLAKNEYDAARLQAEQMLAFDSDNIPARVLLAEIDLAQGKISAAIQELDEGAAVDPNYRAVLLTRANAYLQKKDPLKGLVDITRLIERSPFDMDAYAVAGRLYLLQENFDQARTFADKALRLDPEHADAHLVYLGIAAAKKDWQEVIAYGKKMSDIGIQDVVMFATLCQAYFEQEEYDQALEYGKRALELDSTLENVNSRLMHISWQRGDIDQAIEYARLVTRHGKDKELLESTRRDQAFLKSIPPLQDGKRTLRSSGIPYILTYDNAKWVQTDSSSGDSSWRVHLDANQTWGVEAEISFFITKGEDKNGPLTLKQFISDYEGFLQLIYGSGYQVLEKGSHPLAHGTAVMRTVQRAGEGYRERGKEYYLYYRGYIIRIEFYSDPADFNQVNAEVEKLLATFEIKP